MPTIHKRHTVWQGRRATSGLPPWLQGCLSHIRCHPGLSTARSQQRLISGGRGGGTRQALTRVLAAALLTVGALFASGFAPASAHGLTGGDSGTDPKHGVHLASPAVVRLVSDVSGQVICHACINGQTLKLPLDRPTYDLIFTGSGAFVSPQGYILTADHVVDFDNNTDVIVDFFNAAVTDLATAAGITPDAAKQFFLNALQQGQLEVPTQVTFQRAFVATPYTGQLRTATQILSYPVTRIVVHSPPDKQDIAIIKVEAQDVPNLMPAPAGSVHVQDSATAVAFPADADTGDFTALVHPTDANINSIGGLLSPTVETGSVIAQKPLPDGTTAYETTGISNHGSSGGAVIDTQGRIIGFVDRFTTSTESNRVTILVPSEVIAEYMRQAGISDAGQGQFETAWAKAISEYDASGTCHWTKAAADLRQVQQQYTQFGGIQSYLDTAQSSATPAECPPPPSGPPPWLIAAGIGGALLILLLITVLLVSRGRRKPPQPMPAAPMDMAGSHSQAVPLR